MEETERSLQTLIKLACNAECITSLVDGLSACLSSILTINEQGEHPVLDRLLHKPLQPDATGNSTFNFRLSAWNNV